MPSWFLKIKSKGAKKASNEVRGLTGNLDSMASSAKKAALAFGVGFLGKQLYDVGKNAIGVAAQFETLQVRLGNMYGSVKRGEQAFQSFNKVAATTPFQLANVVEAGASMKAFGMDAENMIKPVADLAAFMGIEVVDAASAMGRAFAGGAGAADVLKERGIIELVKSFKGIEDITQLTLPEFRKALTDALTDPELGIAGATTKLADTWAGAVSNFQDSTDRLRAAIGTELIDYLRPKLDAVNEKLSEMGELGWDNIGSAFIKNSQMFIDTGARVMGIGGHIIGLAFADGLGKTIEMALPDIMSVIKLAMMPVFGNLSFDIFDDLLGDVKNLDAPLVQFEGHSKEISALFKEMGTILQETYGKWMQSSSELGESVEVENVILEKTDLLYNEWFNSLEKIPEPMGTISEALKDAATDQRIYNKVMSDSNIQIRAQVNAYAYLAQGLSDLNESARGSALVTARLQQASIIASTASGMMAAISPPWGKADLEGWLNFAAIGAAGASSTLSISQSIGDFKKAADGADYITNGPEMLMVGDNAGGKERVEITPLSSENKKGPKDSKQITNINITGNLMTQEFTEDQLIPIIKQALIDGSDLDHHHVGWSRPIWIDG